MLTIKEAEQEAYISMLPNAELPGEGDVFRSNNPLGLYMDDSRVAILGRDRILGIDLELPATKLQWHELAKTEGRND